MARFHLRVAFGAAFLAFSLLILLYKSMGQGKSNEAKVKLPVSSDCRKWTDVLRYREAVLKSDGKVVLVTGAAGFIGSKVVKYCSSRLRMKVIAVDNLSEGFIKNLPLDSATVQFVKGDLRDIDFVTKLFEANNFDFVYHLADYSTNYLSHFTRTSTYRDGLVASSQLVNAAVKGKVKCFVFISSTSVYGEPADRFLMKETQTLSPKHPHGISKLAVELDLKSAKETFDLDFVILRPHNVFGINQKLVNPLANTVASFMIQVSNNEPIVIEGGGEQKKSFTYVDDIIVLISRAPLLPSARNQEFNVGADQVVTVKDLADMVFQAMGKKNHKIAYAPFEKKAKDELVDHSKVKCFFNPPPARELSETLDLMATWIKSSKSYEWRKRKLKNPRGELEIPGDWMKRDKPKEIPK
eukprot:m.311292 g.311292  ORF g.311292 m.311292 type:complete len:411 (+) comp64406_c0_seq1:62-1294(+)